jgi:hypothetical protein
MRKIPAHVAFKFTVGGWNGFARLRSHDRKPTPRFLLPSISYGFDRDTAISLHAR